MIFKRCLRCVITCKAYSGNFLKVLNERNLHRKPTVYNKIDV